MKSVADEVKDVLSLSTRPKTMKEIAKALDYKYPSSQISASIKYWEKRGEIVGEIRQGYNKNKEYQLFG